MTPEAGPNRPGRRGGVEARAARLANLDETARAADPSRAPELVDHVLDPDPAVRAAALAALGAIDRAPEHAILREAIGGPCPTTREAALRALGLVGEPEDLEFLAACAAGAEGRGRQAALEALARIWPGPGAAPTGAGLGEFEVQAERTLRGPDGDGGSRPSPEDPAAAEAKLARTGLLASDASRAGGILRMLGAPERKVAVLGCRLARWAARNWTPDAAERAFEAARPIDRPALAYSFRRFGGARFAERFRKDLGPGDPPRLRAALRGLGLVGARADGETLFEVARREEPGLVDAALDGLGLLAGREPAVAARLAERLPELARLAGSPRPEVRRATARMLGAVSEGERLLEGLLRDPDPAVKATALRIQLRRAVA